MCKTCPGGGVYNSGKCFVTTSDIERGTTICNSQYSRLAVTNSNDKVNFLKSYVPAGSKYFVSFIFLFKIL